jgi:PRC-barrel domain
MKWLVVVVLSTLTVLTAAGGQAAADANKIGVTAADSKKVEAGWSAKKDLMGRVVYNDRNERVGTVEDLMITPDESGSYAIVETGGFVGLGKHHVAIPLNHFKSENGKFVLPGATKDELKALPEFVKK